MHMIKNVIISIILLVLLRFSLGMESAELYRQALHIIGNYANSFVIVGVLSSVSFVFFSMLINRGALFSLLHNVVHLVFLWSRFLIAFCMVSIVLVWYFLKENLLYDLGYLVLMVPYILFASSSISMLLQDFNFPLIRVLLGSIALPAMVAIVAAILNLFGF